jgi:type II secretory pathway predicted ATPase ExeA
LKKLKTQLIISIINFNKIREIKMFEKFYNLESSPFTKSIQNSQIFSFESQEETLNRLNYVVNNKLFATVTGEVGSGKSTILRKLKGSLDEKKYEFLYIVDSKLTPRHFYNGLLSQLGREGAFYRGDSRRILHHEIELINVVYKRILIISVDEAHLLNKEMLEELRFLLNFKMDSESPLALILSGQPELELTLEKRISLAIKQRIDFRCRLSPMNMEETGEYIKHQLKIVGSKEMIFDDSAINTIFAFTSGNARFVNKVCTSCLMFGAIEKEKIISGNLVESIIESEYK